MHKELGKYLKSGKGSNKNMMVLVWEDSILKLCIEKVIKLRGEKYAADKKLKVLYRTL